MPFVPFTKRDASAAGDPSAPDTTAPAAPAFTKTVSRKRGRRKPGKVSPAQKHLMAGSTRTMAGGRR
jgi:hypothetical protein